MRSRGVRHKVILDPILLAVNENSSFPTKTLLDRPKENSHRVAWQSNTNCRSPVDREQGKGSKAIGATGSSTLKIARMSSRIEITNK